MKSNIQIIQTLAIVLLWTFVSDLYSATLTYTMPQVADKSCDVDIHEEMFLQNSAFRETITGACKRTGNDYDSDERHHDNYYEANINLQFRKFNNDFGILDSAKVKVEVWKPYFKISTSIRHPNNVINTANPHIRIEGQAVTQYDILVKEPTEETVRLLYYNDDRIIVALDRWKSYTSCQNHEEDNDQRCPEHIESSAFRWFWRDICDGCNQDDEAEKTIALEIAYPNYIDANTGSCALESDKTDKWCAGSKLFSQGQRLTENPKNKKHRTLFFDLIDIGEKDAYIGTIPIYFGMLKYTCDLGDECKTESNQDTTFTVVQRPQYRLLLEGYKYVFATDKNGPGCGLWDDGNAPVDDYQACSYDVKLRTEVKDQVSVVYEYAPDTAVPVKDICGDNSRCVYTDSDSGGTYLVPIEVEPYNDSGPIINLKSRWTEVAMISNARFSADAVDLSTVRFGPAEAEAWSYIEDDVNDDGLMDMVLQFFTDDIGIECGNTSASLNGVMPTGGGIKDGNFFIGADQITVINNYGENQGRKAGSGKGKKVGWDTAFCN